MNRNAHDIRTWRFVAMMLGAASLGIALARAMRLPAWDDVDAESWGVVSRIYHQLALSGALLAIGTIAALIGTIVALRERPRAQALTGVSLMMYAIGVIAWAGGAPTLWAIVDVFGLAALTASVLDDTPAETRTRVVHHTLPRWRVPATSR